MSPEILSQIRNRIVDSLIERSLVGEIKWDFSRMDDGLIFYPVTTEFGRVKYFSYYEQSSGVRLEAYRDKELVGIFSLQDAGRLREVLDRLSLEDSVALEVRKQQRRRYRQDEKRRRKEETENLQRLREIQHGLEGERR